MPRARCQVMVSDGTRLAQWERREVRQPSEPRSVPQMIRALNTARKNNRLYVRLLASDAGAVVSGEPLSSLPPSVLGVLESDRSAGEFVPLRNATLGEWDLPTEYAVVGIPHAVADPGRRISLECVDIDFEPLLRRSLVAAAAVTLLASKPVFWQTATVNDFLRGEVENLSIDGHGRLVLGPATELFSETTSPFLWAMAAAPDGSLFVGSGNEGKVFKIDAPGKTTTFFDTTRARSARAGAGARRHAVRRHVARRAHLQDRSQRQRRAVLRSRRQVHLEPGAGRARATFTPAPARRA